MQGAVAGLLFAVVLHPLVDVEAQQFTARPAAGVAMQLPDGRTLVLVEDTAGVMIGSLVDGSSTAGPVLDLQTGDRVTRFQGLARPGLTGIDSLYRGLTPGREVSLEIRRGAGQHLVRFLRPATPAGTALVVAGPGKAAGAWVTGGGTGGPTELVIAGAHIRDNSEGLPEVAWRSSHPAMATVALRTGDVISTINGQPIAALAGLGLGYNHLAPGDSVKLTVRRGASVVPVTFVKPEP